MKNFLKSDRHLHKNESVRLEAVGEFNADDPAHQTLLESLVDSDDSVAVRIACMKKISSLSYLNQAMQASDESPLAAAATGRMTEIVASTTNATELDAFLINASDSACEIIAASAEAAEPRLRALAKISDEAVLVRIIESSRYHDTRLSAAQKLVGHDSLRAALAASRSRDKEVAKHIQRRLDDFAEKEATDIAAHHAANELNASIAGLATSVWSPQTKGRLEAITIKWSALESKYQAKQKSAFEENLAKVEALIAAEEEKAKEEKPTSRDNSAVDAAAARTISQPKAEPKPEATKVPVVPDDEGVKSLKVSLMVESLDELPAKVASVKSGESATLVNSSENAKKLLAHADALSVLFDPPFDTHSARVYAVKERTRRVDTLLQVDTHLASIDLAGISYLEKLEAHKEELNVRLGKAKQESDDRIKATHRQFSALSGTVKDGKWGPASSMFRRLQKKIGSMDASERSVFADKLSRAEVELNTMSDWQDFAARPKLEALCGRMEALPAQELSPEALAKEVRTIQNEWKGLGVSRASNDLWTRFKTAGDTAYEPCKAYFGEKQKLRQEKIDNKKTVCVELEKSIAGIDLDAESVDWKALQRTVNDAKRDWSNNRVTDRKPDRKLEERFTQLLKPAEAKLGEQYEANAAEKKELIEKITKIAEGEINQHVANQARSLQASWKAVGITRRKEDQVLWEQFNEQCRTVFKTIKDAEREKYKASMGHVFRAKDIIKTLKQHAKAGDADDAKIQALTNEFNELAEFPERDKKFLLRDFRGALDANNKKQETKTRQKRQQAFDEVKRCVVLCERLEDAVELPELITGTLIEEVTDSWDATEVALPKEWQTPLTARRDSAITHLNASSQYDYAKTESSRRDLLIRMEVAADVDTPAEDKSLRMQFQLANLQKGMTGSAVVDKKAELKLLEREWLSMPPAPRDKRDGLNSRYLNAMKA